MLRAQTHVGGRQHARSFAEGSGESVKRPFDRVQSGGGVEGEAPQRGEGEGAREKWARRTSWIPSQNSVDGRFRLRGRIACIVA